MGQVFASRLKNPAWVNLSGTGLSEISAILVVFHNDHW
jgi:hypothetical protein